MSLKRPAECRSRTRLALVPLLWITLFGASVTALAAKAVGRGPTWDAVDFAELPGPVVATPADLYGPLFRSAQLARVFPDDKTFADAVPRRDTGQIMATYRSQHPATPIGLRGFVLANFILPPAVASRPLTVKPDQVTLPQYLVMLWPTLTRRASSQSSGSALPLPSSYLVPGRNDRELRYWESYFMMLGLASDKRTDLVENMIDDFTTLIERYGHIPNGARSYELSRSAPPVYYLMLGLSPARDVTSFRRRLAALRAEHDYWMAGEESLQPGQARFHVVKLTDGTLLNRYWDARATPREENYAADVSTAAGAHRPPPAVYRDLRASAESGWDGSPRWLADGHSASTVHTTDIVPVDLNSLMAGMERMIALACDRIGDDLCARQYNARVHARIAALRTHFWDARGGRYADLDWRTGRPTPIVSAATLFPLFVGAARADQAHAVALTVRTHLLAPSGLRATTSDLGAQWDGSNDRAALQWVAEKGLRRYGEAVLAHTIASRWLMSVQKRYSDHGTLDGTYERIRRRNGSRGSTDDQGPVGETGGVMRVLTDLYPYP